MNIVCLDTMVIQWGVLKRIRDTDTQAMMDRASDFIAWLDKQKCQVILPTIVVGELLLPIDSVGYSKALSEINTKWLVVDYDVRAALFFSQMTQDRAVRDTLRKIKHGDHNITRSHLKADMMILATARAYGATRLYSHDDPFIEIAKHYLSAHNFMNVEDVQLSLQEPSDDYQE